MSEADKTDPIPFATEEKPVFFWAENYKGEIAKGGYFIRSSLKEFIQKLIEAGETPVAIKFDGSYNLEILVKPKEEEFTKGEIEKTIPEDATTETKLDSFRG